MNLELNGKVALVTGSTTGIGESVAAAFAAENATVIVNGRQQARVDETIARLRSEYPASQVTGVAADVSTVEGVNEVLRAVPTVDILVNNAGIYIPKPFMEITDADWHQILEVNVMSGVRLSRAYLGGMLERDWGRVVFVSSESGIQTPVEMIHYGVTKTAQLALSRGLAEMTVGTKVTVNSVLPGPTLTEGVGRFLEDLSRQRNLDRANIERDFVRSVRPTSLIQRLETPEEIAAFIAFVCSPLASGINGASLRVDGGCVRSIF